MQRGWLSKRLSRNSTMPIVGSALSPYASRHRTVRKPAVRSAAGIVVSQNRAASEIGARVLKAGGHAVDAAVATAFALGVVEPWMSGIGGVGAALVRDASSGTVTAFDFGGRSPKGLRATDFKLRAAGADSDLFGWPAVEGNINTVGAKAVVAPTEPAGLALMHTSFGRQRWGDLVMPAVALARQGLAVDWHTTLVIATAFADLARDPGCTARFLPNGAPPVPPAATDPKPATHLALQQLAATLEVLADKGAAALYAGPLAHAIAADIRAMGGYLDVADLAAVAPRTVTPKQISYRDRTIHVLPELNGGPTLDMAFRHLSQHRPPPGTAPDAAAFSAYAHALRHAWAWRFEHMGDAGERTAPTSTTHLTVVDRDGNVVALTQTLLSLFGARIVLPQTGILMNNGVNWFDPRPGGPNGIAADKRVLANYAPAIMTGADRVVGIGGCGGRKIIPAVFQLLALSADYGLDLDQVFHQPRIDVSGTGRIAVDRRLDAATVELLARDFDVVSAEPVVFTNPFTIASAVARSSAGNEGATEPEQPWADAVAEDEV
jgi:gamma-glutamyltranspeptidase / glutathione hydrolase